MNLGKAILKAELAQSFAAKVEAIELTTQRDVWQIEGYLDALKRAAAAMDQHRPYYQQQCDEGILDGSQTTMAMDVINRCIGGLQSLADKAALAKQLKQGELQGVRRSIDLLEKEYKAELAKVQAVGDLMEHDGRPDTGPVEDIKRRKEAAKTERAADMPTKKKATKKKATKKKATKKKKGAAKKDGSAKPKTKKKTAKK